MPPETRSAVSEDLHGLSDIPGLLTGADREGYDCPQYGYLILTENADVVACCQLPKDRPEFLCGNVLQEDLSSLLERRRETPVCRECIRTGLASYINSSIRPPASYRKGIRQSFLFLRQKLRRALTGRK